MNLLFRFVLAIGLVLLAPLVIAAPPSTINYQGYLTSGPPGSTPVNGTVPMTFSLYAASIGGTAVWTEMQPAVAVTNGNFNALLGAVTPFTVATVPFDVPYFLEIAIGNVGSAETLGPRQPLASSPYAFRAASLDSAATIPTSSLTGTIGTANLAVTQQLPAVQCTTNQIPKWSGTAWACAADDTAAVTGGSAGQVLAGTAVGTPIWTDSPTLNGNLTLANPSTSSTGNIMKGANRFIHNAGTNNTFIGENAGNFAMTGVNNTASGQGALASNTSGDSNTASGQAALNNNTFGVQNTASGSGALFFNTSGNSNTASGYAALLNLNSGFANSNTAIGANALYTATNAATNTAVGAGALGGLSAGNDNIAIGNSAGTDLTSGNNNIYISDTGVATESNTIRIGKAGLFTIGAHSKIFVGGLGNAIAGGTAVYANFNTGQLGNNPSSRRFKDDITSMNEASSALMQLRPVTFYYKTDDNPAGRTLQYGLIAEEVAEVYPGLVLHAADGQIETVMYQHLPPMLLNEFQKQQRTIAAQAVDIQTQAAEMTQQRARVELLERELQTIKAMLGSR